MKQCKICKGFYPPNAIVCPACYDIIGGQIVPVAHKPKAEPRPEKPLPQVEIDDLVRFPISPTTYYEGQVERIAKNGLGEVVAHVWVAGHGSQWARLRDCEVLERAEQETCRVEVMA